MTEYGYYKDALPISAIKDNTKRKAQDIRAAFAAAVLAAFLVGGGLGLAVGVKAGERRAELRQTEYEAVSVQNEER